MSLTRRLILALALFAGFSPAFAQAPPPVPALPDTERRTSYSISGTNCTCAVGFQLYADSSDIANWLEVFINGVRANFNDPSFGWAITSPTGSIASIPRPITDAVLTFTNVQTGTIQIVGARRPRRTTQFSESAGVPARNLNQAFTDIIAMLREDWDKINDVSGRAILAAPGETLALLPAAATRANQGACFDSSGNLVNCVSVPSTTFTAGNGIVFTGVGPTSIKANLAAGPNVTITGTNPLSINVPLAAGPGISLTGSNPLTIGLSASGSLQAIASRTAAAAQNLSGITTVQTLGYAAAGDGGGALFKNVGSAPFLDSNIATGTISAAGTAYTNGTYLGVLFTGGTGTGFMANVTVAGGGITVVTPSFTPGGWGFTVGDVLTTAAANIGGTGSGFTYTVSTVTTPKGSFTDTSGAHFQLVADAGNFLNPRQFGAVFNWIGVDGSATDDAAALQAAFNFAGYWQTSIFSTNGTGVGGTRVMLPRGFAMINSPLIVYGGTQVEGQGILNSGIHLSDAFSPASANGIELCEPAAHVACLTPKISRLVLSATATPAANAGTYMIHTNAAQQSTSIEDVSVYPGKRGCFRYDTGFGGASNFIAKGLWCTLFTAGGGINDGIVLNAGTTVLHFYDLIVEAGGAGFTGNGVNAIGGQITIDGFHSEGVTNPVNVSLATATHSLTLMHATGGGICANLVTLQGANTPGNFALYDAVKNGCTTNLILDGQAGGTATRAGDAKPKDGWVFANP